MKLWKKENDFLSLPKDNLGFDKEKPTNMSLTSAQNYLIKKFALTSVNQVEEIKTQLLKKRVLIINASDVLENKSIPIQELKSALDEIRSFLKQNGGSIGRIGDQYLIVTPNSHIKLSN